MAKRKISSLEARRRIKRLAEHADRRGWKMQTWDPDGPEDPEVCLYTYDLATGAIVVGGLSKTRLRELMSSYRHWPDEVVFSLLGTAIRDQAETGKGSFDAIMAIAGLYAGRTQTWQRLRETPTTGIWHFMVLHYRSGAEPLLRPFALSTSERGLLSLDDLHACARQVVEHDRANNPQWLLPSAEVLPFPQRTPFDRSE